MSIDSLIKAIIVLHHGNRTQHSVMNCSVAKQIDENEIHSMTLDGQSIDVVEIILTAKHPAFTINENVATRTIETLCIAVTKTLETKLLLQKYYTEAPVVCGEIIFTAERPTMKISQLTTIEEYAKICKDFELYFEGE